MTAPRAAGGQGVEPAQPSGDGRRVDLEDRDALTVAEVASIEAQHILSYAGDWCYHCKEPWPCVTKRLVTARDALRGQLAEARGPRKLVDCHGCGEAAHEGEHEMNCWNCGGDDDMRSYCCECYDAEDVSCRLDEEIAAEIDAGRSRVERLGCNDAERVAQGVPVLGCESAAHSGAADRGGLARHSHHLSGVRGAGADDCGPSGQRGGAR